MKKELGKWFLDIAKYIITAVVLASIFNQIDNVQVTAAIGVLTVAITLSVGLYLLNDKKK
ncbi:MAG: hypothetical protein J6B33_01980 [Prevotella sp.]|nr:hypothetical protein [Prevotella sp.]